MLFILQDLAMSFSRELYEREFGQGSSGSDPESQHKDQVGVSTSILPPPFLILYFSLSLNVRAVNYGEITVDVKIRK